MLSDERLAVIANAHRERAGEQSVLLAALLLAEETGEAVQQVRRLIGNARRSATADDVGAELADVLISAGMGSPRCRTSHATVGAAAFSG